MQNRMDYFSSLFFYNFPSFCFGIRCVRASDMFGLTALFKRGRQRDTLAEQSSEGNGDAM